MTRGELQEAARTWLDGRHLDSATVKEFGARLVEWSGRPAFRFPTSTGVDRIRFLDDERPKAGWAGTGGGAHWYGLERAAELLRNGGGDRLYLVNGEPSVWACAQAGVPAVCTCSGETWVPDPDEVAPLREMLEQTGADVAVVFDLDDPGRRGARSMVAALRGCGIRATALELPENLGEGGDVDDLHQRIGDEGLGAALAELPELQDLDPFDEVLAPIRELSGQPAPSELQHALEVFADNVRAVDGLTREVARGHAIQLLKERKVPAPAKAVDAALGPADEGDEALPAAAPLADIEPWPDEVEGGELLTELRDTIRRFVVMPEESADAVALWIMHAHAHDAGTISPLLAITSPEKRCGKTLLLDILASLAPRPLPAANVTAAVLFRVVEAYRPTLLIDEADTFLKDSDDLRGILNSGHRRSGAVALRCEGEDFTPRAFSTWCAKSVALIGHLPTTLEDRSVVVRMRRRAPDETFDRWRGDRHPEELAPLARKAARWAADHVDDLRHADPEMPADLHDRAADNWRPLIAIADSCGGEWAGRARQAALAVSSGEPDAESIGVLLLSDIRDLFRRRRSDRIASAELVAELGKMEERPWPEYRRGHAITVRQVAAVLRRYKIQPKKLRDGAEVVRGYLAEAFGDAFDRYLSPDGGARSGTPEQRNADSAFQEITSGTQNENVPDRKSGKGPPPLNCSTVPDRKGETPGGKGGMDDDVLIIE